MNETISRRGFVGAAMGATGAGLVAMAAPLGARAEEAGGDWMPEAWDREADVIVVGAGCGGIATAVEACELGLSVLVIDGESESFAGGSSRLNGGMLSAKSAEVLKDGSFGDLSDEWCETMADEHLKTVSWIEEHGIDAENNYVTGNGPALYEGLKTILSQTEAEVMWETRATSLVQNPATGEVVGVRATTVDGEVALGAGRGVVLATGCFAANSYAIDQFYFPGAKITNLTAPYLDGTGHKLAFMAGARPWHTPYGLEFYAMCATEASDELGMGLCLTMPADNPSAIWVNAGGKRFMNEDNYGMIHFKSRPDVLDYAGGTILGYHGAVGYANLPAYMIFDEACLAAGSIGNTHEISTFARFDETGYVWSEDNQAELERGWIKKADTLSELAELLDVDPEALEQTVRAYNEGLEAGEDAFGRGMAAQIGDGPYYGLEVNPGIVYTVGGPKTTLEGQVVDWNEEVIPGLYAVGDISHDMHYPMGIPGVMAHGRLAARHLAGLGA